MVWQNQRKTVFSLMLIATLSIGSTRAMGQTPRPPGLGYVYPPVVRAGETTTVQFGGFDFTVDMQWYVHDERVKLQTDGPPGDYHLPPPPYWVAPRTGTTALPIPREVPGRLTVDAAAPEGLVRWQVANASGASDTGMVFISHGAETVEARSRDFPQKLPSLPIGVSGRLSRLTEVDRYQITTEKEGIVTVELLARRLGSDFNGVLQVHNAEGKMLTDFADVAGLDGAVAFAAVAGATYTISLFDADFRGDRAYVYHLGITQAPRVICSVPAAGQRGSTGSIEFFGIGLGTGAPVAETVKQEVTLSQDPMQASQRLSVLTAFGASEVAVPLSDVPEQIAELSGGDSSGTPRMLTAPGAVTGRMLPGNTVHRFQWQAEKDEYWAISVQSRSLGSRMDAAVEILDAAGNRVADGDDSPGTTDPSLEFQAKTAGIHTVVIRNLSAAALKAEDATAIDVYRLELQRSRPDFSLSLPQRITLPSAGKTEISVQATRYGGFAEEIRVAAEGLPAGVTVQGDPLIPAGAKEVKLTLESAADAAVTAQVIHIRGTAKVGEMEVSHPAMATAGGNLSSRSAADIRIPHVLLAMTMTAPFEILVVDRERQHDVHRGTTFLAELDIVRKPGFEGEINLEMSAQQARYRCGIRGGILPVPTGQTRAFYPVFMPEWLGTELTRRIVVHGVAPIPDPKGNLRYLTAAGDARITMILEGALLKLNSAPLELTVTPGAAFEIPVSISRSAKLPLPVSVELVVPEEIKGVLRSETLSLAVDHDLGVLNVATDSSPSLEGPWTFTIRATALQDGKWPVVSETDVPVSFTAP